MRTYIGVREESGRTRIDVAVPDAPARALPAPAYHSPTGMEWGYGGSGPADAALAILLDLFDELNPVTASGRGGALERTRAFRIHQAFKWAVVVRLPHGGWLLHEEYLREAVRLIERDEGEGAAR